MHQSAMILLFISFNNLNQIKHWNVSVNEFLIAFYGLCALARDLDIASEQQQTEIKYFYL